VNTTDGHAREVLDDWFEERGLAPRPADVARARAVREALRELLVTNNEGGAPQVEAIEALEGAASRARLTLRFRPRAELVPLAEGVESELGRILTTVYAAMGDGTWARLKACRNCHWAFYDYSRNRSAGWCSMSLCGNRLKTRAYRARRLTRSR
jgi:predicted RNA-binding Zn ribbon-like protein